MKGINFFVFTEQLREKLKQKFGCGAKIHIHETVKNNGVSYYAVAILEEGNNISPNIRLDDFYQSYLEGEGIESIAEDIAAVYERAGKEKMDLSFFQDFEKAKSNILLKVVGFETNREQLKKIPHIKFMDLALTFYYYIEGQTGENASIQIENSHLEFWNVDAGKLYDLAVENAVQRMPAQLRNICDIIHAFSRQNGVEPSPETMDEFERETDRLPMFVLSNRKNYFGAAVIYYPGVLKRIAGEMYSDLIILPSSVHEVILLPADGTENIGKLNEMIAEINQNQLAREEVLSDHLYYYDLERDELFVP